MRISAIAILLLWACFLAAQTNVTCAGGGSDHGLQAAITGASCGTTINVQAGCSYSSSTGFTVANKSCTAGSPLIIQSADVASLPAAGRRLDDTNINTYRSHLPKLVVTSPGSDILVINNPYTEIRGFELTNSISGGSTSNLIDVFAQHVTIDRNFGHCQEWPFASNGTPAAGPYGTWETSCVTATVNVASSYTTITGNYFSMFGLAPGTFSAAGDEGIVGAGDATNVTVTNNDMEFGYSAMFLGGSDPTPISQGTITGTPTIGSSSTTGQLTLTAAPTSPTAMVVGQGIAIQLPYASGYCDRPLPNPCWGNAWVTNISGSTITYTGITYQAPGNVLTYLSATNPSVVPAGNVVWDAGNADNWTITQNKFYTRPEYQTYWKTHNPGAGGPCKGFFEMKTLTNSVMRGNYFDGWACQSAFNAVNQHGAGIKNKVSNVTFDSNWINKLAVFGGMGFSEEYKNPAGLGADNIVYSNNVIAGPVNQFYGDPVLGASIFLSQAVQGSAHITYQHNTILSGLNTPSHACPVGSTDSNGDCYSQHMGIYTANDSHYPTMNIVFRDNLFGIGNYGFECDGGGTFPSCTTGQIASWLQDHNMVVDNTGNQAWSGLFSTSSVVNSWKNESATGLGLTKSARMANPDNGDYRLCSAAGVPDASCVGASVGYNAASDGTDIGANIATINSALGPDNPQLGGAIPSIAGGWTISGGSAIH